MWNDDRNGASPSLKHREDAVKSLVGGFSTDVMHFCGAGEREEREKERKKNSLILFFFSFSEKEDEGEWKEETDQTKLFARVAEKRKKKKSLKSLEANACVRSTVSY